VRKDGELIYYRVQHKQTNGSWVDSDLPYMLFSGLHPADRDGEVGDRYRTIIAEQSASTPLWQEYGVTGFVEPGHAWVALRAVREQRGDPLRVVRIHESQRTEEVEPPRTDQVTELSRRADLAFSRLGAMGAAVKPCSMFTPLHGPWKPSDPEWDWVWGRRATSVQRQEALARYA
jgi:hypothetical protein